MMDKSVEVIVKLESVSLIGEIGCARVEDTLAGLSLTDFGPKSRSFKAICLLNLLISSRLATADTPMAKTKLYLIARKVGLLRKNWF